MDSPTLLVIGNDFGSASVRTQAGTLAGWADERGVRVTTAFAPDGLPVETLHGADAPDAVAVLGSTDGAWDDTVPWLAGEVAFLRAAVEAGVPVLGLCFGGQILARVLGGRALAATGDEHGWHVVDTAAPAEVPAGPWLEFHGDSFTPPPGAAVLASTPRCTQAFALGPHLGVQFHPEITPAGYEIWAASWAGTPFESEYMAGLGLSTAGVRAEVAAHAEGSRDASHVLFDAFAARAGLGARMLEV